MGGGHAIAGPPTGGVTRRAGAKRGEVMAIYR
jgi:hypothetical protein